VEQENGAPGVVATHSARNVLPGEPFDPPLTGQVPGPRPAPAPEPVQPLAQPADEALPPPLWNYGPASEPLAAPVGAPIGAPGAPAQVPADFETLQDYASLPAAQTFGAPTAPPSYTPQSYAPQSYAPQPYAPQPYAPQPYAPQAAPPAYAPAAAVPPAYTPHDAAPQAFSPAAPAGYAAPPAPPAWPAATQMPAPEGFAPAQHPDMYSALPPLPFAPVEEPPSEGKRRRRTSSGKSPDKRLLAVALVAVLAGGGYFGYTQLSKKSDTTTPAAAAPTTPVAPVLTVTPYAFPTHVAGFALRTGSAAVLQNRQLRAFAIKAYPTFGKTVSIASYSAGTPAIVAMSFQPGAARLAPTYSTVLSNVRKPATGNVVGAFTAMPPGAAGGRMTCGRQRGASPISYCVWQGKTTVGLMYMTGSTNSQITEILTREIRAYAEH
jgi:hypothetical protein